MYYTVNNAKQYFATEGFIQTIKDGIRKTLLNIICFLKSKISNLHDSRIKKIAMSLLTKAENLLDRTDSTTSDEDIQEIKSEVESVEENVKLLFGKAMWLHSRTYYEDFTIPALVYPDLNSNADNKTNIKLMNQLRGDYFRLRPNTDLCDDTILIDFQSPIGYYVKGISGLLKKICNENNIQPFGSFSKTGFVDVNHRDCIVFFGYISSSPIIEFNSSINIMPFVSELEKVWLHRNVKPIKSHFY